VKLLSTTNWGTRLASLGYDLCGNARDMDGRVWKYRTSGKIGGAVGYFNSLRELVFYIRQIEETRLMVEHPDRHMLGVRLGVYPVNRDWPKSHPGAVYDGVFYAN
jgi:hypothetical protein